MYIVNCVLLLYIHFFSVCIFDLILTSTYKNKQKHSQERKREGKKNDLSFIANGIDSFALLSTVVDDAAIFHIYCIYIFKMTNYGKIDLTPVKRKCAKLTNANSRRAQTFREYIQYFDV